MQNSIQITSDTKPSLREFLAAWTALIYFALIGYILWDSSGFHNNNAWKWLTLLLVGLAVTIYTAIWNPITLAEGKCADRLAPWLIIICLSFFAMTAYRDRMRAELQFQTPFRVMSLVGVGCMVVIGAQVLLRLTYLRHVRNLLLVGAALIPITQRVLIPIAAPEVFIDVLVVDNLVCDHLLAGENPYSKVYPNIYADAGWPHEHLAEPHVFYWPAYYFWASPFRWGFGDVRFSHVAAESITAILLILIALHLKWKLYQAFLVAIAWLAHPISLYVTEQGWIDPVMTMGTAASVLLYLKRRWIPLAIACGFTASVKQYGFLLPLFVAISLWKLRLSFFKFSMVTALTAAILILPYALQDFSAFMEPSKEIFRVPPRSDALSIAGLFMRSSGTVPSAAITSGPALIGLLVSIVIALKTSPRQPVLWMASIVTTFCIMFVFGKQAFCNYYHLLASFVLLWMLVCEEGIRHEGASG